MISTKIFWSGIFFLGLMAQANKPLVYTTFYPTTFFANRIGENLIEVVNPVPPEEDPIFWEPPREVLLQFHKADLIILNGAGFEKWVNAVSLPKSKVVNTSKVFESEYLTYSNKVTHSHGGGESHSHEGVDGHTWLDPILAIKQAEEIKKALSKIMPKQSATFQRNFQQLSKDLMKLDSAYRSISIPKKHFTLYASHPAYNYIAKRYDWPMISLDFDPEMSPDAHAIEELNGKLKKNPGKIILWESAPKAEIKKLLKEKTGLNSLVFHPCEGLSDEDIKAGNDYLKVMHKNIKTLQTEVHP